MKSTPEQEYQKAQAQYDAEMYRLKKARRRTQLQSNLLGWTNRAQRRATKREVDARLRRLSKDQDEQGWLLHYAATALPATNDGLPDVEEAARIFRERERGR